VAFKRHPLDKTKKVESAESGYNILAILVQGHLKWQVSLAKIIINSEGAYAAVGTETGLRWMLWKGDEKYWQP
jgi:hypothetical protein